MDKLRWENVGRIRGNDYIDRDKVQAICDEGYRLITIIGDINMLQRFGNPIYGIFEPTGRSVTEPEPKPVTPPKPPVVKTAPPDPRIPTRRQSFAEKVRAQMEADAKGKKKE